MTQELRSNRFKWKLLLLWVLCSKVNILIANIWIFPNKHSDMALQRFKWKYGVIVWFHIRHGFHWWYDIMPKDFTFIPRDDPSRLLQWLVLCIQGKKITKCRIIISTEPQRALKAESFYHDVIEDVFGMMTFQYFITITSCYCNL